MAKKYKANKKTQMALDVFRALKTTTKRTKYGSRAMVGKGSIEGNKAYAVRFKTKNGRSVTKITLID